MKIHSRLLTLICLIIQGSALASIIGQDNRRTAAGNSHEERAMQTTVQTKGSFERDNKIWKELGSGVLVINTQIVITSMHGLFRNLDITDPIGKLSVSSDPQKDWRDIIPIDLKQTQCIKKYDICVAVLKEPVQGAAAVDVIDIPDMKFYRQQSLSALGKIINVAFHRDPLKNTEVDPVDIKRVQQCAYRKLEAGDFAYLYEHGYYVQTDCDLKSVASGSGNFIIDGNKILLSSINIGDRRSQQGSTDGEAYDGNSHASIAIRINDEIIALLRDRANFVENKGRYAH